MRPGKPVRSLPESLSPPAADIEPDFFTPRNSPASVAANNTHFAADTIDYVPDGEEDNSCQDADDCDINADDQPDDQPDHLVDTYDDAEMTIHISGVNTYDQSKCDEGVRYISSLY